MSRMIAYNSKKEQDLFAKKEESQTEKTTILEHFKNVIVTEENKAAEIKKETVNY